MDALFCRSVLLFEESFAQKTAQIVVKNNNFTKYYDIVKLCLLKIESANKINFIPI